MKEFIGRILRRTSTSETTRSNISHDTTAVVMTDITNEDASQDASSAPTETASSEKTSPSGVMDFPGDDQVSKLLPPPFAKPGSDSTSTTEGLIPPPPLTEKTEGLIIDFPDQSSPTSSSSCSPTTTTTKKKKNLSVTFQPNPQVQSVESFAVTSHLRSKLWYNQSDLNSFQKEKGENIAMVRMLNRFTANKRNSTTGGKSSAEGWSDLTDPTMAKYAQLRMKEANATSIGIENHVDTGITWTQMTTLREKHRKAVLIEQWKQLGEFAIRDIGSIARVSLEESEWARKRSEEIGILHSQYEQEDYVDSDYDSDSEEGEKGTIDWDDAESVDSIEVREGLDSSAKLGTYGKLLSSKSQEATAVKEVAKFRPQKVHATQEATSQTKKDIESLRQEMARVKAGSARNLLATTPPSEPSKALPRRRRPPRNTPNDQRKASADATRENIRSLRESIKHKMSIHQLALVPEEKERLGLLEPSRPKPISQPSLKGIDWGSSESSDSADDTTTKKQLCSPSDCDDGLDTSSRSSTVSKSSSVAIHAMSIPSQYLVPNEGKVTRRLTPPSACLGRHIFISTRTISNLHTNFRPFNF